MKTISVIGANYLDAFKLELSFNDGKKQVVDFEPSIRKIRVPEYKIYQNTEYFKQFKIENGNVVWGEDWDLIFPVAQLYKGKIKA